MARAFTGSTSVYAQVVAGPSANQAAVVTIAAWVNATSFSGAPSLVDIGGSTTANQLLAFDASGNVNAVPNNAGGQTAASGTAASTGSWAHIAGVFNGLSSRTAYLNGVAGTANTVTATNLSISGRTSIAVFYNGGSLSKSFNGNAADIAIWTAALTTLEINSLASGCRPSRIRPGSLWAYWPCDGLSSPEPDLVGSARNLTLTGSPAQIFGPPVTLWTPKLNLVKVAPGWDGSTSPPLAYYDRPSIGSMQVIPY